MALHDSLSQLAGTSLDFAQARLELIALDLKDSAWQLAVLILMSVIAGLSVVLAVALVSLAFVFAYWETNPVWALAIVALGYSTAGIILIVLVFRRLKNPTFLMADSIQMIREDRQMLRDLPR